MNTLKELQAPHLALKRHEKNALRFLSIDHVVKLSSLIGYDLNTIEKLINEPRYQEFKISKKKGGYRIIEAPNPILKKVQKTLNCYLQACYLLVKPASVHGFVINPSDLEVKHNIRSNASAHIQKKAILNIDIENFFQNISAKQVYELLKSEPFNFTDEISKVIALLCTYKAHLPTGAPTSAVLSNLVCLHLDYALAELANSYNCTYTRYADDLSFSSDGNIELAFEERVYEVLELNGFKSQSKKRRLQKYYQHQSVTGIVVNEKLNLNRDKLKKVRAMLHDAETNGLLIASQRHYGNISQSKQSSITLQFLHYLIAEVSYIKHIRGNDSLTMQFEKQLNLIKYQFVL